MLLTLLIKNNNFVLPKVQFGGLTGEAINPLLLPMFPDLALIAGLLLVLIRLLELVKVLSLQLLLQMILGILTSKLEETLSRTAFYGGAGSL